MNDGWFLTGDSASWTRRAPPPEGAEEDRHLRGGPQVLPEEVEDCINQFPGSRNPRVQPTARGVGEVPAPSRPGAPALGPRGLKAHCARVLSTYKVPVEFTVVDAVPRTPSGKIRR